MTKPMQKPSTGDTIAAPTTGHVDEPRRPVADVIAAAELRWKIAAGVTAFLALAATVRAHVPLASGVAVAVLTLAALVDLQERRLPDVIVLMATATAIVCLILERLVGGLDIQLSGAAIGAGLFAGPLFVVHLASPASMGFGDVKTAAVLGASIGLVDWQAALAALAIAAGLTATVGLLGRARTVAFGPGLVAASAFLLLAHPVFLTDASRPAGETTTAVSAEVTPAAAATGNRPSERILG